MQRPFWLAKPIRLKRVASASPRSAPRIRRRISSKERESILAVSKSAPAATMPRRLTSGWFPRELHSTDKAPRSFLNRQLEHPPARALRERRLQLRHLQRKH